MPTSAPDDRPAPPLLEVRGLTAGYGRLPAIFDVGVEVAAGEVVAVVGPNGAGKSTLLKAVAGLLPAMAGSIRLSNQDVTGRASFHLARAGLGYVPQLDDVFDPLTVAENLRMGGYSLDRQELARRVEEVVAVFPQISGLLGRTARKLSGGERKMVAVGRALMLRPKVLLLDEPTANLSPMLANALLAEHVRQLADSGVAVLLVEQRAMAALRVADLAVVMVSGRVSLSAPAAELAGRSDLGELFLKGAQSIQPATRAQS